MTMSFGASFHLLVWMEQHLGASFYLLDWVLLDAFITD